MLGILYKVFFFLDLVMRNEAGNVLYMYDFEWIFSSNTFVSHNFIVKTISDVRPLMNHYAGSVFSTTHAILIKLDTIMDEGGAVFADRSINLYPEQFD